MAYYVDGEITLISRKLAGSNSKGIPQYVSEERTIPCKVESVSRSEFFRAGQAGINIENIFVVNPIEYRNELRILYEGTTLKIYRTFRRSMDEIELYAGNAEGLNG